MMEQILCSYRDHTLCEQFRSYPFSEIGIPKMMNSFKTPSFTPDKRNPITVVTCLSFEQSAQLKPRSKRRRLLKDVGIKKDSPDVQIGKPASFLCKKIRNLVHLRKYREALELFEIVECGAIDCNVDSATYASLIDGCIALKSKNAVRRVYDHIRKTGFQMDRNMKSVIVLMHVKCGMMVDAMRLFHESDEMSIYPGSVILKKLVDSKDYRMALDFFLVMWNKYRISDSYMFYKVIRVCSQLGLVFLARQLHSYLIKSGLGNGIYMYCTLIDMYSKLGLIRDAKIFFDQMPVKTVKEWNSLIAGYMSNGYKEQALSLFYEMHKTGLKMDHFIITTVIRACSHLGSLELATQIHACLVCRGFESDTVASTALIDIYCKWGKIEDAQRIFDSMLRKTIISWNALITGYGLRGRGNDAIKIFNQLVYEGFVPSHITFFVVLSACKYSGLSSDGWKIFESMSRKFGLIPHSMHYACMVELLGREGLLDEAFALITESPVFTTMNMWAALLTACRIHGNLKLGRYAAEMILLMKPDKLRNCIILLNIYNCLNMPDKAAYVLEKLKTKGLCILPACSWIMVKKIRHQFLFGDKTHDQSCDIHKRLDVLMEEISKYGFVKGKRAQVLQDIYECSEQMQAYHSELLAVAFGLIAAPSFAPLQVVQSHRICDDCHIVIKLATVATKREITVKDGSRFHHFKHGACSCGDYW